MAEAAALIWLQDSAGLPPDEIKELILATGAKTLSDLEVLTSEQWNSLPLPNESIKRTRIAISERKTGSGGQLSRKSIPRDINVPVPLESGKRSEGASPLTGSPLSSKAGSPYPLAPAGVNGDGHVLCDNDTVAAAAWRCQDCALDLCAACDNVFHLNPARRCHTRERLGQGTGLREWNEQEARIRSLEDQLSSVTDLLNMAFELDEVGDVMVVPVKRVMSPSDSTTTVIRAQGRARSAAWKRQSLGSFDQEAVRRALESIKTPERSMPALISRDDADGLGVSAVSNPELVPSSSLGEDPFFLLFREQGSHARRKSAPDNDLRVDAERLTVSADPDLLSSPRQDRLRELEGEMETLRSQLAEEKRHVAELAAGKEDLDDLTPAAAEELEKAMEAGRRLPQRLLVVKAQIKFAAEDQLSAAVEPDAAPAAPSGTVAMMFTDVKGSTALWERNAQVAHQALMVHNRLIRAVLARFGGYEVKTEGDAFMAAFASAADAVACALAIQEELLDAEWPEELLTYPEAVEHDADGRLLYRGLRVRIGIHVGQPEFQEVDPISRRMDYFGSLVNKASRIESAAQGGQLLVSKEVRAEISAAPVPAVVDVADLGVHPLKGVGPERLFQVSSARIAARRFSPPVTCAAEPKDLRAELDLARKESAFLLRALSRLQESYGRFDENIECLETQLRTTEVSGRRRASTATGKWAKGRRADRLSGGADGVVSASAPQQDQSKSLRVKLDDLRRTLGRSGYQRSTSQPQRGLSASRQEEIERLRMFSATLPLQAKQPEGSPNSSRRHTLHKTGARGRPWGSVDTCVG